VFSLVNSAVNTTLPAFAAERRAPAPLLLDAGVRRYRSICPVCGALSSKPARATAAVERWNRQTDGRTNVGDNTSDEEINKLCFENNVQVL